MQLVTIILLIMMAYFIIYLVYGIRVNSNDTYHAIKSDEEFGYLLRNYATLHDIQSYKLSLSYLFLHMDNITIKYVCSGEKIIISRLYDTYYVNGSSFHPPNMTTDMLWKFISSELLAMKPNMYKIEIKYASNTTNPSPIYKNE